VYHPLCHTTSAVYVPLWHTNICSIGSVMAYEHLQYTFRYGIRISAVYDPLWHTYICCIWSVMAYVHLQYMIRYGIRTSAVYDPLLLTNICSIWSVIAYVHLQCNPLWHTNTCSVWSFMGLSLCCGVAANSAQHSSNNLNFISRDCRGTTYLHYTNPSWTSARLNMAVVNNRLKIRFIRDSNGALRNM
jgi:hypothetical protein